MGQMNSYIVSASLREDLSNLSQQKAARIQCLSKLSRQTKAQIDNIMKDLVSSAIEQLPEVWKERVCINHDEHDSFYFHVDESMPITVAIPVPAGFRLRSVVLSKEVSKGKTYFIQEVRELRRNDGKAESIAFLLSDCQLDDEFWKGEKTIYATPSSEQLLVVQDMLEKLSIREKSKCADVF